MSSVNDVAAYVLDRSGPVRAMKLEKVTYYGQAWHLAWIGSPLFSEAIEAWKNGPIVRALWNRHRGRDLIRKWNGNPATLSDEQRTTLDRVLAFYGKLTGDELSALTHSEQPWRDARNGVKAGQPGTQEIPHAALRNFYSNAKTLVNSDDLQEMVSNLVRRLPSGSWGVNTHHAQPLYIGYASRLLAPTICGQLRGQNYE